MTKQNRKKTKYASIPNLRKKAIVNFGLFFVFFAFYIFSATLCTPLLRDYAMIPVFGMPICLLSSLLVFPLSGILIAIWFKKGG
ncbi:MAG: hypothetical protein KAI61_02420 [Alphaproteobacteria bacterium]|nr:hypothetical protein [Alphaproteobacteria bacterium]MCK5518244.1 hypothetical protein [Alphaproteobacteria bacterium]